ncbi:MAG: AraC family transcriptional regulator [Lachnospiraceae bacterium]
MGEEDIRKLKNKYSVFYEEKTIKSIRRKLTGIMFERQEYGLSHNTLQWEENAFEAVKSGTEAIRRFLCQDADGEMGMLSGEWLRNVKNHCICTICVLTRQILNAHLLDLEHAFSLSDACIQCIEESLEETECIQVTIAAMEEFSSLIKAKPQTEYHHLIRETKEYVFKHLHTKIEVKAIAAGLKTNPDYLSRIFHKYEGIPLHQYIIQKKLENAKHMLQYSEYTNDEIAQFLGFSSQSHLQTLFKRSTGLTLGEFRLRHNETYRDTF